MAKPVVLTVDDDPDVLQAVARDLRHQYGDRYRIMRADSGMAALDAIEKLKLRNESVALFLVDQRMPQMGGVEFLQKAKESDLLAAAKQQGNQALKMMTFMVENAGWELVVKKDLVTQETLEKLFD